jgi:predicted transcriptional regulator
MTRGKAQPLAKVAAALATARKRLGLSQTAVAQRAGVTQAAVSHIERGSLNPRLTTFLDLVRALELDVRLVPRQIAPVLDAFLQSQERSTKDRTVPRALYALDSDDES